MANMSPEYKKLMAEENTEQELNVDALCRVARLWERQTSGHARNKAVVALRI